MENGQVVEFDTPSVLQRNKKSKFWAIASALTRTEKKKKLKAWWMLIFKYICTY